MIPHESPHESTSLFHLLSFAFQSDQPDPLLVPLVSGVFTWIGRLTFGTLLLFVEEGGAIFTIFHNFQLLKFCDLHPLLCENMEAQGTTLVSCVDPSDDEAGESFQGWKFMAALQLSLRTRLVPLVLIDFKIF